MGGDSLFHLRPLFNEHRLLAHDLLQRYSFHRLSVSKHDAFINDDKNTECDKTYRKVKFVFGYTLNTGKYNVNHDFQQSVLIDRSDDKSDISRGTVTVEDRVFTVCALIAEHTHHGNVLLVGTYNGRHSDIQRGKRQHNANNKIS